MFKNSAAQSLLHQHQQTTPFTKLLGNAGEAAVTALLEKKGFRILACNYTIRGGEIDIIAAHNNLIAFVEVKTRSRASFALSQVITPSKQRKIILTAKHFILHHGFCDTTYRFDVALVEGNALSYIPNAFSEQKNFF